jgi:N6-L-threonylcarbamoyladenine synthase
LYILALESSCDENSAAVMRDGEVVALQICTQSVHQQYGGVVPELAGRSHLELVDQLACDAMRDAKIEISDLNLVAATIGPGLIGSLLVGLNYGRGLSLAADIPFRPMHHLEAHLWSAEITCGLMPLPFLILLASGGHTQLVLVRGLRDYEILGSTLDDALGEAYDKVGKLIGLKFPAGADVDRIAKTGVSSEFSFPTVMNDNTLNFSFSGLKTSFLYTMRKVAEDKLTQKIPNLLASFQDAALKSVMLKVRKAVDQVQPLALVAAGGVAANSLMRSEMQNLAKELGISCYFPLLKHCGDNAAMIGYLAWKLETADVKVDPTLVARPRWSLETLMDTDSQL